MRLVLRQDVSAVGKKGDIIEVADGFARNFLVPKGLAFLATDGVVDQAARMRRARDLADAKDRSSAQEIARTLVPMTISLKMKAGPEGRLFGAVHAGDVVTAVANQTRIELDRKTVHLHENIKSVGTYQVPVKLHNDVQFVVNLDVVAG
jgi:large subunit ribosomal protein L9